MRRRRYGLCRGSQQCTDSTGRKSHNAALCAISSQKSAELHFSFGSDQQFSSAPAAKPTRGWFLEESSVSVAVGMQRATLGVWPCWERWRGQPIVILLTLSFCCCSFSSFIDWNIVYSPTFSSSIDPCTFPAWEAAWSFPFSPKVGWFFC